MARFLGPDNGSAYVFLPSGAPAVGRTATVYTDAACTTLADIAAYQPDLPATPGSVIASAQVTADGHGRLTFWFPDGVNELYASVNSVVSRVTADLQDQIDDLAAASVGAETTAGAQAKADAAQAAAIAAAAADATTKAGSAQAAAIAAAATDATTKANAAAAASDPAGAATAAQAAAIAASAQRAANLADLANAATARSNLGLGTSATRSIGTTAGTAAAGDDPRIPAVYNVRVYGAAGDGTTNDTAAIQAAINAANTAGGGTVYVPASTGPYRHTGLTIHTGVTLAGDGVGVQGGGGSELRMLGDTAPAIYGADVTYVTIRDLCLTGTAGGSPGSWDGILFEKTGVLATASIAMENVLLVGFSRHGVYMEDVITSALSNVRSQNNGGYGIYLNVGTSNTLTSCYANGCESGGFRLTSMSYSALIACAADSCGGTAYDVGGGSSNTLIACGCEANAPGAVGYLLDAGANHTLISCYANGHGGVGVHVTDAATEITIQGFREVNPPVGATASIKVDAGCTATVTSYAVDTAPVFATGTTKQWDGPVLFHTSPSTVALTLDRGANTNFANLIWSRAGVDCWALGTRNNSTDDLHLISSVRETAALVIEDRATAPNMSLLTNVKSYGGGIGVLYLPNAAAAPSTNPTGGGVLYSDGGALRWRGPSGQVSAISGPATVAPADQGLIAWTFDPALAVSNTGPSTGVLTLSRVQVREAVTVSNVWLAVATAGVALTAGQNLAGLYSSAGALLGQTADQTAAWGSTGVKTAALTVPAAVQPGWYWIGILSVATTSTPSLARAGAGAVAGISSAGLAATASRFASYSTGLTALPGSLTLGSVTTATNGTFWAGLS